MNLRQLQDNFEALATEDPLWTVLSENEKRGGKWDQEAFYATGESLIDDLEIRLKVLNRDLGGEIAIDFGCGVGRLTFPLAKRFKTCIGIDISDSMISYATGQMDRGGNCQFLKNTESRLDRFQDSSIDFAYSAIVFQHIAPKYTRDYIREFSRIIRPGGLLVFQLPSHLDPKFEGNRKLFPLFRKRLGYRIKSLRRQISTWLPFLRKESFFEMNAIPRDEVTSLLSDECEFETLAIQEFPAAGPEWISYLYLVQKRQQSHEILL